MQIGLIDSPSPMHRHTHYEIIIYTKGTGTLSTKTMQLQCSPGTIIIMPPFRMHASTSETDYERIFISGEFSQFLHMTSPVILSDNADGEGVQLAKMIYRNRFGNPEYLTALTNALFHFILQNIEADDAVHSAIRDIIEKISDRFFDSNLGLQALLQKSGYAEDYIRAQFKKITGKTPVQFLTEIRISHACFLIDTYKNSLSLTEVAEKCGFVDYIYFSRRFKQVTGLSPRQYAALN